MYLDEYASFLVRCWREQPANQEAIDAQRGCWHGEIEHIQSGVRWHFATLAALLDFLRQAAITPVTTSQSDTEERRH